MYVVIEAMLATGQIRVVAFTDSKREAKGRKRLLKNPAFFAEINQNMEKEITYFLLMVGLRQPQIRSCMIFIHQLMDQYGIVQNSSQVPYNRMN